MTTTPLPAGPPRLTRGGTVFLLLLASLVAGFIGGYISARMNPGPVNATCYVTDSLTDASTHTPVCVYGRPLR
jgi:hypothetical protein